MLIAVSNSRKATVYSPQPRGRHGQAAARRGLAFPVVEDQMKLERTLREREALSIFLAQKCRHCGYRQRPRFEGLIAQACGAFAHEREMATGGC